MLVDGTVRKPVTRATPAVEALLAHLDDFPGAPRHLGRDDQSRQVLEYVPGTLDDLPATPAELRRVGRLIRDLHDAIADFRPPADASWEVVIPPDRDDLVCHHDLAPWNLVRGEGDRWVFIDWDGAGPGSRLWDLGYAAHGFVPLHAGGDPAVDGPRLRALADGYRLDQEQRAELPAMAPPTPVACTTSCARRRRSRGPASARRATPTTGVPPPTTSSDTSTPGASHSGDASAATEPSPGDTGESWSARHCSS